MGLNEPRGETGRQGVGKQPAGRGLVLKFGRDRVGNLGQERVSKAFLVTQRRRNRMIEFHAQGGLCEAIGRQIDMQYPW